MKPNVFGGKETQFMFFHTIKKSITVLPAMAVLLGLQAVHPAAMEAQRYDRYQDRYQTDARGPVDSTINNLKNIAAANTYSSKERSRYDTAMTHLSQFAESMQRGRFDRGKLDRSIGDVQNVLSKNPLDGRARDILNNDIMQLRRLRDTYPR
jgi:hypothetical protein